MKIIPFSQLEEADLTVDAVYEGSGSGNLSDDPIAKLLKCGNAGRFRFCGSVEKPRYLVFFSLNDDMDWPDKLDLESGIFKCYGDNRKPGSALHETSRKGNLILRNMFEKLCGHPGSRTDIPPIFLFSRQPTPSSPRSVQFRGVCAPGALHLNREEGLSVVWKSKDSQRFENYHATFTVLDIPVVSRKWIQDLDSGHCVESHVPLVWNMWLKSGLYRPLRAKPLLRIRPIEEQLPPEDSKRAMLFKLYRYFKAAPGRFEYFAADLYRMSDPRAMVESIARSAAGDGYEVFGRYRIGPESDPIFMTFLLEAKCYNPGFGQRKRKSVGVKEAARLISRIKNGKFGVMVTTSTVASQAYQEARTHDHPVVFLCGSDIVDILYARGIDSVKKLETWLVENYPF